MDNTQHQRIAAFDFAKGMAIFLVVWMHSIQYLFGETFSNPVYRFVYSFHMPLFFIISGYLFEQKLSKPITETTIKLFKRLLIPNILWGIMLTSITSAFFHKPISTTGILNAFWFLYTLFFVSFGYLIASKICPFSIIITLSLTFLVLLLPGCEFIKFATPFFGLGMICGNKNIINKHLNNSILIFGSIFILVLYMIFWRGDEYVYISPAPSITIASTTGWREWLYRIIFGSIISILIILVLKKIQCNRSFICNHLIFFSRHSLGIYVTHLFLFTICFLSFNTLIKPEHSGLTFITSFIIASITVILISKWVDTASNNKFFRYLY